MNIRIMAHQVKVKLVRKFKERDDVSGQQYNQDKEIIVEVESDRGRRKPVSALFVTFLHEIGHEIDDCTGHRLFFDEDADERARKEGAMVAFSEGLAQVLIGNGIVSKEWLAKFEEEAKKAQQIS